MDSSKSRKTKVRISWSSSIQGERTVIFQTSITGASPPLDSSSSSRKPKTTNIYMGRLYIDIFYHQLHLPEHLQTFFVLPLIFICKRKEKLRSQLKTVSMEFSYSVTTSKAIHEELRLSKSSLSEKDKIKERSSWTNLECGFGLYTDEFFVLGKDSRNVMRTYDLAWGTFERVNLSSSHR